MRLCQLSLAQPLLISCIRVNLVNKTAYMMRGLRKKCKFVELNILLFRKPYLKIV